MNDQSRHLLLQREGVTAVWDGIKTKGGQATGQRAVIVAVRKKLPPGQVKAEALVPLTIEGELTDVVEADFKPLSLPRLDPVRRKRRIRPAMGGISISSIRLSGSGTFGCLVRYKGRPCILSNAHVFANLASQSTPKYEIGDPVIQPGIGDGGSMGQDIVAYLVGIIAPKIGIENRNLVDCAIAAPDWPERVSHEILGYGQYRELAYAELGWTVVKSGRTSGITIGEVVGVNGTVVLDYGLGGLSYMDDQLIIKAVSQPGDSGSAVLTPAEKLVGLLFGGDTVQGYFASNRIQNVMKALGAEPSYFEPGQPPAEPFLPLWRRIWEYIKGVFS